MEVGAEKREECYFHITHKIPSGDGPYARAKHLQLVEKDLNASIVWFWEAINSSDKVDSALKDMAVVLKQLGRAGEAVEAIKSLRLLCSKQAQHSLDNLLIDLYKACGKLKEEIELLKQKLRKIFRGETFHGRTTKKARSHGRKIHVSVKQETSRLLGNLAWAYIQQSNYKAAEAVYRKAQMIDPDANMACNLSLCLIEQGRLAEAERILLDTLGEKHHSGNLNSKIARKAEEMLLRIRARSQPRQQHEAKPQTVEDEMMEVLDAAVRQWAPYKSRRLPIFEEISPQTQRVQMAC